ncbi:hypothetical protein L2E82_01454 [Cichorium intybus]|uniref:Uncharacterized protein n=1 Tax=Cichorium intybus TaxID=13427 RepID=A0ACB9H067_CICIN|nr:hypothetical protein L2E82_01454 [Cichorium intybus]
MDRGVKRKRSNPLIGMENGYVGSPASPSRPKPSESSQVRDCHGIVPSHNVDGSQVENYHDIVPPSHVGGYQVSLNAQEFSILMILIGSVMWILDG